MPYGEVDTVEVVRPRLRGWQTAAVGALIGLGFAVVFFLPVFVIGAGPSGPLPAVVIGPLIAAAIAVVLLIVGRWRLRAFMVPTSALTLLAADAVGLMLASAGDLMLPILFGVSSALGSPSSSVQSFSTDPVVAIMVVAWAGSVALWNVGLFSAIRRTAASRPRPWLWPMLSGIAMAVLQSAAITGGLALAAARAS